MVDPSLIEALASRDHDRWTAWAVHFLNNIEPEGYGDIPACIGCGLTGEHHDSCEIERWVRRAATPYEDLPQEEKDTYLFEALSVLAILREKGPVQ